MFLVSVPKIFKIGTSKVTCEISAFYDFVENSITLSLVCFKK